LKDTAVNIPREKEFVVHLADEAIAQQMHRCGERFAADVSELEQVGLSTLASTRVKPPRIAEAPVAFECALWETLETASRHIFIGRVLMLHARDELIDIDTWRVRLEHYFPVGRFGASDYVTTRDRFQM
jgi:flavin reductase (DIM6/NTAB) family NADH-FMN oxidoreductase RutF